MKKLQDVIDFLSDIPDINAGGCGIAALAIYRWMEKNASKMLENIEIVFLYNDDWQYDTNCTRIRCGECSLVVPAHVVLRDVISEYEYDAKCAWMGRKQEHTVDVQHLITTINIPVENGWSPWFKRKENVEKIAKKLKISLSDVNINYELE